MSLDGVKAFREPLTESSAMQEQSTTYASISAALRIFACCLMYFSLWPFDYRHFSYTSLNTQVWC